MARPRRLRARHTQIARAADPSADAASAPRTASASTTRRSSRSRQFASRVARSEPRSDAPLRVGFPFGARSRARLRLDARAASGARRLRVRLHALPLLPRRELRLRQGGPCRASPRRPPSPPPPSPRRLPERRRAAASRAASALSSPRRSRSRSSRVASASRRFARRRRSCSAADARRSASTVRRFEPPPPPRIGRLERERAFPRGASPRLRGRGDPRAGAPPPPIRRAHRRLGLAELITRRAERVARARMRAALAASATRCEPPPRTPTASGGSPPRTSDAPLRLWCAPLQERRLRLRERPLERALLRVPRPFHLRAKVRAVFLPTQRPSRPEARRIPSPPRRPHSGSSSLSSARVAAASFDAASARAEREARIFSAASPSVLCASLRAAVFPLPASASSATRRRFRDATLLLRRPRGLLRRPHRRRGEERLCSRRRRETSRRRLRRAHARALAPLRVRHRAPNELGNRRCRPHSRPSPS